MLRSQNLTNPKNPAKYNPMINSQGKADISTVKTPLADGGNPFKDSVVQDVVYHGTEWDFYDDFIPDVIGLIHFGTKKAAFDRNPLVVKQAYISLKNPLRVEDAGDHWDGHHLIMAAIEQGYDVKIRPFGTELGPALAGLYQHDQAMEEIKRLGIDGIVYENIKEDAGNDSYAVFDPKQIKVLSNLPVE
jgi:hypothetical protein